MRTKADVFDHIAAALHTTIGKNGDPRADRVAHQFPGPVAPQFGESVPFQAMVEIEDTIAFAKALKALGIDVVDCSAGGIPRAATVGWAPRGPGFQVPYVEAVRRTAIADRNIGGSPEMAAPSEKPRRKSDALCSRSISTRHSMS